MNSFALVADNLSCEYERWGQRIRSLDGINITIPKGQWVMLAGHNGAGKSTLLRIIAGHLQNYTGSIIINGTSTEKIKLHQFPNHIYYVNQDPTLGSAPLLTVFENLLVADPLSKRKPRRNLEEQYYDLLAKAGLQSRLHHPASHLSGGERQLLAFLIARLRPAPIVLLDEAFAAMDASRTDTCLSLLRDLQVDGKTLLFITHSLQQAENYGDRTIILSNGQLVYDKLGSDRIFDQIYSAISTKKGTE
jgi:putative tryptophan/tyrosine transport system ATP-binding protein